MLPLTTVQRGLWSAQKMGSGDNVLNIAEAVEIRGSIDLALLRRALVQVAAETDAIRTRIVEQNGLPRQIVEATFDYPVPIVDVSDDPDPAGLAMRWMMQDVLAPIDLARDQLWRCILFRTGPEHVFWYQRGHHIIGDGFSAAMLAQRVATLYSAFVTGEQPPESNFGALADLVENEARYRGSERQATDRAYWSRQLADLPPPATLTRRQTPSWGGLLRTTCHLSEARTAGLANCVRGMNISLPQVLIALVAAYFHRVSGIDDLVVKMPVSARVGGPMRRIPGMVANAVPLRFRFDPAMTLERLFLEVGRLTRAALRHQCYRYEDMRHDLGFIGENQQICRLGINIEPFNYRLRFGEHEAITHNLCNGSVEDLIVFVYDRADSHGLRIDFDASPALYSRAELTVHQEGLLAFIEAAPEALHMPIDQIARDRQPAPADTAGERSGPTARAPVRTLVELVSAQTARTPEALAVATRDDPSHDLRYRALDADSTRLAHRLRAGRIAAGQLVAVALPRDRALPAALLGVLKAGAAYLLLDPEAEPRIHAALLDDAEPAAILVANAADRRFAATGIPHIVLDDPAEADPDMTAALPPPDPDATAYVIYTCGGRSHRPRGYPVAHWNLSDYLAASLSELEPGPTDRFLVVPDGTSGLGGFAIGAVELFVPLVAGAGLVFASDTAAADGISFMLTCDPHGPLAADPARSASSPAAAATHARQPSAFGRLSWTPTPGARRPSRHPADPSGPDEATQPGISLLAVPSERTGHRREG